MTAQLKESIRDSKTARWIVLGLVAFTMAAGYFFTDVLSPIEDVLIKQLKWDGAQYGFFAGQYSFLNIIGFIILGGIILDKLGIRATGISFVLLMIFGGAIKAYGLSDYFNNGGFGYEFFNSFAKDYQPSVKVATLGFALFGLGVEIAGVTVSRIIVKWFKGKEMALAMGLEMALARLGMGAAFVLSPRIAADVSAYKPVIFGVIVLCAGFLAFLVHCMMDAKLDKEIDDEQEAEEPFKLTDIVKLFQNKGFVLIAVLCVLFYSCVFPFTKFAANLLVNKYGVASAMAGDIVFILPFGTIILTPIFGTIYDRIGKGATMMMLGSILLIATHLIFSLLPGDIVFAYLGMFVLGVGFSLVPSAMWPSVPKIVAENRLGTAYSLIFWIQNIGLWLFPMLIGSIREASNPGVAEKLQNGETAIYDYTNPMLLLVVVGVVSLITALGLKMIDKKQGYGLELPNIQK
ncbi:MFS transporter [Marinifilum fragile]|uniref:MFS transporter n=1 Tax=Marinifilum fragile TaxID=570161 RepID=UPI002AA7F1C5|nr:MFS transporter [Marinifilum fragile]